MEIKRLKNLKKMRYFLLEKKKDNFEKNKKGKYCTSLWKGIELFAALNELRFHSN